MALAPPYSLACRVIFAVVGLSGCLITNPGEVDQPINTPPSLRSPESSQSVNPAMNRIVEAIYDTNEDIEISLIVRDENVRDRLNYQVLVDFREEGSAGFLVSFMSGGVITPTADLAEERTFSVTVPHSALAPEVACHRIEVLVSREFDPSSRGFREPVEDGDLGMAVFWVAMKLDSNDDPGMNSCP